jgi:hypothetical protein
MQRNGRAVALAIAALAGLLLADCTSFFRSSIDVSSSDRLNAAIINACRAHAIQSRDQLLKKLARLGLATPVVHTEEVIGTSDEGQFSCNWGWGPDASLANDQAFAHCKMHGSSLGQGCSLLISDDTLAGWAIRILHDDTLLSTCESCGTDVPQVPGANGLIPYAHSKRKAPEITARDELKYSCTSRFPNRGLVLSGGSFLNKEATFYMVDIDSQSLRRIVLNHAKPELKNGQLLQAPSVIWVDKTVQLGPGELNPLIIRMNQIWRDGVSYKKQLQPTGVVSALTLLDGEIAFDDSGSSLHAPDAVLADDVTVLASQHSLARDGGAPTSEPCDPNPSR